MARLSETSQVRLRAVSGWLTAALLASLVVGLSPAPAAAADGAMIFHGCDETKDVGEFLFTIVNSENVEIEYDLVVFSNGAEYHSEIYFAPPDGVSRTRVISDLPDGSYSAKAIVSANPVAETDTIDFECADTSQLSAPIGVWARLNGEIMEFGWTAGDYRDSDYKWFVYRDGQLRATDKSDGATGDSFDLLGLSGSYCIQVKSLGNGELPDSSLAPNGLSECVVVEVQGSPSTVTWDREPTCSGTKAKIGATFKNNHPDSVRYGLRIAGTMHGFSYMLEPGESRKISLGGIPSDTQSIVALEDGEVWGDPVIFEFPYCAGRLATPVVMSSIVDDGTNLRFDWDRIDHATGYNWTAVYPNGVGSTGQTRTSETEATIPINGQYGEPICFEVVAKASDASLDSKASEPECPIVEDLTSRCGWTISGDADSFSTYSFVRKQIVSTPPTNTSSVRLVTKTDCDTEGRFAWQNYATVCKYASEWIEEFSAPLDIAEGEAVENLACEVLQDPYGQVSQDLLTAARNSIWRSCPASDVFALCTRDSVHLTDLSESEKAIYSEVLKHLFNNGYGGTLNQSEDTALRMRIERACLLANCDQIDEITVYVPGGQQAGVAPDADEQRIMPQTGLHISGALLANPQWHLLTRDRVGHLDFPQGWYSDEPWRSDARNECYPRERPNETCDEFPFRSTEQVGDRSGTFASLKLVPRSEASPQGSDIGNFYLKCGTNSHQQPFIVISPPGRFIEENGPSMGVQLTNSQGSSSTDKCL